MDDDFNGMTLFLSKSCHHGKHRRQIMPTTTCGHTQLEHITTSPIAVLQPTLLIQYEPSVQLSKWRRLQRIRDITSD